MPHFFSSIKSLPNEILLCCSGKCLFGLSQKYYNPRIILFCPGMSIELLICYHHQCDIYFIKLYRYLTKLTISLFYLSLFSNNRNCNVFFHALFALIKSKTQSIQNFHVLIYSFVSFENIVHSKQVLICVSTSQFRKMHFYQVFFLQTNDRIKYQIVAFRFINARINSFILLL